MFQGRSGGSRAAWARKRAGSIGAAAAAGSLFKGDLGRASDRLVTTAVAHRNSSGGGGGRGRGRGAAFTPVVFSGSRGVGEGAGGSAGGPRETEAPPTSREGCPAERVSRHTASVFACGGGGGEGGGCGGPGDVKPTRDGRGVSAHAGRRAGGRVGGGAPSGPGPRRPGRAAAAAQPPPPPSSPQSRAPCGRPPGAREEAGRAGGAGWGAASGRGGAEFSPRGWRQGGWWVAGGGGAPGAREGRHVRGAGLPAAVDLAEQKHGAVGRSGVVAAWPGGVGKSGRRGVGSEGRSSHPPASARGRAPAPRSEERRRARAWGRLGTAPRFSARAMGTRTATSPASSGRAACAPRPPEAARDGGTGVRARSARKERRAERRDGGTAGRRGVGGAQGARGGRGGRRRRSRRRPCGRSPGGPRTPRRGGPAVRRVGEVGEIAHVRGEALAGAGEQAGQGRAAVAMARFVWGRAGLFAPGGGRPALRRPRSRGTGARPRRRARAAPAAGAQEPSSAAGQRGGVAPRAEGRGPAPPRGGRASCRQGQALAGAGGADKGRCWVGAGPALHDVVFWCRTLPRRRRARARRPRAWRGPLPHASTRKARGGGQEGVPSRVRWGRRLQSATGGERKKALEEATAPSSRERATARSAEPARSRPPECRGLL